MAETVVRYISQKQYVNEKLKEAAQAISWYRHCLRLESGYRIEEARAALEKVMATLAVQRMTQEQHKMYDELFYKEA